MSVSYRYYRLKSISGLTDILNLSEFQIVNAGTRIAGATPTASSAPTGTVDSLNDGGLFSGCTWGLSVAQDPSFWYKLDFGSNTTATGFKLSPMNFSGRYPTGFVVEGSSDNATWKTLCTVSGATYPGDYTLSQEYTLTDPTDPYGANVSLLLHCDGTNGSTTFTDNSNAGYTVTPIGNASISTAQSKFGGASAYFDGNGDYLKLNGESAFTFGTGDFTIEAFIRRDAVGSYAFIFSGTPLGTTGYYINLLVDSSDVLRFSTNGSATIIGSTPLVANVWYHVAASRSSGNTKLFLNGSQEGSTYTDGNNYLSVGTNRPIIGNLGSDPTPNWGSGYYIDEFRITKGVGRYVTSFTPPTAAFPDPAPLNFCAVAPTGVSTTSLNGTTWTARSSFPNLEFIGGIAWSGSVFCVPSGAADLVYTSSDGITWTERTIPTTGGWVTSIAWNGSVFCIVYGDSNKSATSPDGITWTLGTLPSVDWWAMIAWNGSVFCTVPKLGAVTNKAATSPDGITWTARTLPASREWSVIAAKGSMFALPGAGSNVVATSSDGITWTERTLPRSDNWQAIASNGSVFCALIAGWIHGAISTDGITWTETTFSTNDIWGAIAWNGAVFCALAINSTSAMTSPDGITWTDTTLPGSGNWAIAAGTITEPIPSTENSINGSVTLTIIPSSTITFHSLALSIAGSSSIVVTPHSTMILVSSPTVYISINETFALSGSLLFKEVHNIFENIRSIDSSSAPSITKILVSEYLRALDSLLNSSTLVISESIGVLSTLSGIIHQLEYIVETLSFLDSTQTSGSVLGTIIDVIRLADSVRYGLAVGISEDLGLQVLLDTLFNMVNRVLENLAVLGEDGSTYIHMVSLADSVAIDPSILHTSIFNNALLDSFIISIPTASGQDTYLAYLLNTETNSVSTYTNYSFKCSTLFNGKYLLGNSSGLYEYGGTTDAGEVIEARVKTLAYNFGTSNLKQIPDMYIGGVGSDQMIVKVSVDNKASVYYKVSNKIKDLHTQRVKFGKGLIGRYFQFELITNSTDTDLESIEFYPIVLRRKL